MNWDLSSGAATVIISGLVLIFGVFHKLVPSKDNSINESFLKSIKDIVDTVKDVLISQNSLLNEQNTTIALMKEKVNGSHDKLDLISRSSIGVPRQLDKIEKMTRDILIKGS